MNYTTPESKGIRTEDILAYVKKLEHIGLATHNVIIARGNDIVYEAYWKPFHKDFCHRQYSVTKSIVAIAIGFLEQDGLLSLDDPIVKFFPEEAKDSQNEHLKKQTIRHMLMMSTCRPCGNWFADKPEDRVKHYFENDPRRDASSHPSGTIYEYDSEGSFVLGVLVERVSGKTLKEFLMEKLFTKIGVSDRNYFLQCPGGHTWGDSAAIFMPIDMLKIARFTLNYGSWNGEQILNEAYLKAATSKQVDNTNINDNMMISAGYGYKFWCTPYGGFYFHGMGCQFAVCDPKKDVILVYNGDNQGKSYALDVIIESFYEMIVNKIEADTIPENPQAQAELKELSDSLTLLTAKGETNSAWVEKINGKTYAMQENPAGIKEFKLTFSEDGGVFSYVNAQGAKEIPFGMCKNVFAKFPQDGYSDLVGTQPGSRRYDSAFSAAWVMPDKLCLLVQAIDTYFGNLYFNFGFRDDMVTIFMEKTAEDFFDEYVGYAQGKQK